MDLPAQGLYQQLHAKPISGEHLEVLGKNASERWSSGEYKTLTVAVTETVKHAGLSPEQVRRVVEFANTDAFQREFKKEGAHRVVNFHGGPADPADILRDLNDGGGGTVFDPGTGDYNQPPGATKLSSVAAEQALFSMLSGSAPELAHAEPLSEALELRDKVASMYDHLTAEMGGLEVMYADLSDRLYDGVKQAALGGVPLGHIAYALESVAPDAEYIKAAFSYLAPRLLQDGVFQSVRQLEESADKVAGARVPNPEHPMLIDFGEYCEALSKLAELRGAKEEAKEALGNLNRFVKQGGKGIIPAIGGALQRGGEMASKAVSPVAERLYEGSGERAGDLASKAVRYGVPLIAANEVRRHAKYSPGFQAAKNTALSVVPMTSQYQQREYDIATGQ